MNTSPISDTTCVSSDGPRPLELRAMSDATCAASYASQPPDPSPRRPSSQIAPEELIPNDKWPAEPSDVVNGNEQFETSVDYKPSDPRRSFDHLRRSISNLQNLVVVVSECSADSILSRLRSPTKHSSDVPVADLSDATQPKKRREMIAEKIGERQKVKEEKKRQKIREEREKWELKCQNELIVRNMEAWSWPGADGSSTMGDDSEEHEEEWYSEHGSNRCSQELESGEVTTERACSTPSLQRYWSHQV